MSLNASAQQIFISSQRLVTRWQMLKEHWNDPIYDGINKKYIVHLDSEVRNAVIASEQMHKVLETAVQELATHDDAPYGERRSRRSDPEVNE
ncbi:MAG: hypothetical protein P8J89_01150 [Phycisphaerales bacterium]|nr:hypothetical protein [Phycisphaerales bacterium]